MTTLGAPASGEPSFPLIGLEGTSYVSNQLATAGPKNAIRNIQQAAGLQQPLCVPLLGMVDQLGISRFEAHRGILVAAKHALLIQVQQANVQTDKIKLERLLNASFKYLGIQELKEVPLAVMEKLEQVPPVFLKQLALDKVIFRELPAKVQRQVWEFDKNLLQADALPPVGQYKYETAVVMRGLAMDEFLPAVSTALQAARPVKGGQGKTDGNASDGEGGVSQSRGFGAASSGGVGASQRKSSSGAGGGAGGVGGAAARPMHRPVTRKILRIGSFVTQLLKGMVGSSQKIYNQTIELCAVKYRDSDSLYVGHKECSYCTLRAQLLMALHDVNSTVATRDRCHELAWTLDAGMTNGFLTEKHLDKLNKFFDDLQQTESAAAARAADVKRKSKNKPGHVQDEAESAGNMLGAGVVEPYLILGDAAVILRDPSAMHLLAGAVMQMCLPAALSGTLPADLPALLPLLRMMALGVEGRQMLRDRKYRFPEVDQRLIRDLLPLLCTWTLMYEADPSPKTNEQMQGPDLPGGWGVPQQAVQGALDLLPRSEVARRLTQTFALNRLLELDWLGTARTCKLLASALKPSAILEGWDFAGALATRLAELVKSRQVTPTATLWHWAVDHLLVKAVDSHTQVHEEVLRLLLAAAPQLQAQELATYLQLTLENSKKSRRRMNKKGGGGGGGLQHSLSLSGLPSLALASDLQSDMGSDIGSDGWAGIQKLKLTASDRVRSVYTMFTRLPHVTSSSVPPLYAYLNEKPDQG